MRSTDPAKPVAVYLADTHFSHSPPAGRGETRAAWYAAQSRYIDQLKRIAHKMPILVAGDLLDRWDSPPELVNFLIDDLPHVYAVAGNHDLPNHNYADIERSAYWTLVKAGKVTNLHPKKLLYVQEMQQEFSGDAKHYRPPTGFHLVGFPCGSDHTQRPSPLQPATGLRVALVHDFVWHKSIAESGFPGAPVDKDVSVHAETFRDFDVLLFGDNHKFLLSNNPGRQKIANAGSFMCRTRDEREFTPRVGVLYSDRGIRWEDIDTSKDIWTADEDVCHVTPEDAAAFMDVLKSLGDMTLNFHKAVRDYVRSNSVSPEVRRLLAEIMEETGP